jgi:hypothetical protein
MTLLLLLLAALIQVRGQPLDGGVVSGSAVLPLERAAGGDTPVLALSSERGDLRLLLDTGATATMVTPELVRRLGLASTPMAPEAFGLAGGGDDCAGLRPRRTRLPDVHLLGPTPGAGRVSLRGIEALVLPVAALPPGVDGVLGAPTLRLQPLWIDPLAGRIGFGAAALALADRDAPLSRQRVPLRWAQGAPLLNLTTPVGILPALADTGAEGLFVSPRLAARLPLPGRGRVLRLVGFCGEQPVEQRDITGLSLSVVTALPARPVGATPPLPVIITDNPVFQALGVEAIVGQELLRKRRQLWRLDINPPWLEVD